MIRGNKQLPVAILDYLRRDFRLSWVNLWIISIRFDVITKAIASEENDGN